MDTLILYWVENVFTSLRELLVQGKNSDIFGWSSWIIPFSVMKRGATIDGGIHEFLFLFGHKQVHFHIG